MNRNTMIGPEAEKIWRAAFVQMLRDGFACEEDDAETDPPALSPEDEESWWARFKADAMPRILADCPAGAGRGRKCAEQWLLCTLTWLVTELVLSEPHDGWHSRFVQGPDGRLVRVFSPVGGAREHRPGPTDN
jgi:hypothetical protein